MATRWSCPYRVKFGECGCEYRSSPTSTFRKGCLTIFYMCDLETNSYAQGGIKFTAISLMTLKVSKGHETIGHSLDKPVMSLYSHHHSQADYYITE